MFLQQAVEYLSVFLIITNFILLASSRIGFCIKAVTVQGIILAVIPVLNEWKHPHTSTIILCAVTLIVKGWIFPRLLHAAIERARVNKEVEPFVGFNASALIGLAMLVFAFWLQTRVPLTGTARSLLLPASFFGILSGFFITIARRKALTQILGYLVLENGIFAFGAVAFPHNPWMLEMGILLDVFVGVFVMGVAVFHISREFDHIDADRLASLRDSMEDL